MESLCSVSKFNWESIQLVKFPQSFFLKLCCDTGELNKKLICSVEISSVSCSGTGPSPLICFFPGNSTCIQTRSKATKKNQNQMTKFKETQRVKQKLSTSWGVSGERLRSDAMVCMSNSLGHCLLCEACLCTFHQTEFKIRLF